MNLPISLQSIRSFVVWVIKCVSFPPFVLEMGQPGSSKCPRVGKQVPLQTQYGSKNWYVNQYLLSTWTSKIIRGHFFYVALRNLYEVLFLMLTFLSWSTYVWEKIKIKTPQSTSLCLLSFLYFTNTVSHNITLCLITISWVKQVLYHLFLYFRKLTFRGKMIGN